MTSWTDRYWNSRDGLRLHYRDYPGREDRPPILCLHGLTRNSRDFENVAERYSGEWRVLAIDFRGRGLSARDPDPERYVPSTYGEDVLELLDDAGVGKAIFFGTSLGGLVTMGIAATARSRLAGTLLNDIGPELKDAGLDRIRTYVGKPLIFYDWDEAGEAMAAKYGEVHPAYGKDEWRRYARRVCREGDGGIELDYDMRIVEAFQKVGEEPPVDSWPMFRALAGSPLTILRGESSDLLSADVARRMAEEIPEAELVTVANVAHAPDLDEPEAVAAIDRLLARTLESEPA